MGHVPRSQVRPEVVRPDAECDLGAQTKALIRRTGTTITVFRRGIRAAEPEIKGGWHLAILRHSKPMQIKPCGLVMSQPSQ